MTRLVVVGGGAAGMSAATAARRTDPALDVTVFEAGDHVAYGMCGIPYYLGGVVDRAERLLAYPPDEFLARGIELRLGTPVTGIEANHVRTAAGEMVGFDALVLAAGAEPVVPRLPGLDDPRVFTVRALADAIRMRELLDAGVRRALVVGAGYVGLEAAEALVERGAETTVVEALPQVLSTVDDPVAELVAGELRRHVRLLPGRRLGGIQPHADRLTAVIGDEHGEERLDVDLVVVAVGIRPATALLAAADRLPSGELLVDDHMRTSVPDVFAAGDCVAHHHRVLGRPAPMPLGPAANKTGRVAGMVAAGGDASFPGVVGTAAVKVFELHVARTGLSLTEAHAAGIAAVATDAQSRSRAKYYPGSEPLFVRLVHEPGGRLLGAQMAGRDGVAKRIDVVATALYAGLGIADLTRLDLSYAPPFAPVYDPVAVAAQRGGKRGR
ncbi:FAD-dependent oxidoreductase [Amycolatopsis alkalitolerans]|uniref:FAD-dependent oxidoreductase n=1 Tax=Amycolatopsis alkalitolerans TaxID=2547244 RepID=UPI00190F9B98|nr:FAD-dependent oxidoreductase [Amycolatopsis alkalitolerans]